jgi:hypothetical protein
MTENEYLQRVAAATGLQHYANQGPWGRKSGAVIGVRDGYVVTIGFNRSGNAAVLVILVRFKKVPDAAALKTSLPQSPAFQTKRPGKLGEVGSDFLRWEWKYSFAKPNADEVAKLATGLCEALLNCVPSYICSGCQQKIHQELDQAAMQYEAIEPNYPNGLVLGIGAAILGGIAWGGVAYAINRIFLYGAIIIGYFVAAGVLKGTKKVTRFGQVIIAILTVASVLFGDAIFFTLQIMKSEKMAFSGRLLKAVLVHLWDLESEGGGGILSLLFALVGAGYALYAARKPKFKAKFEPLGAPAARS